MVPDAHTRTVVDELSQRRGRACAARLSAVDVVHDLIEEQGEAEARIDPRRADGVDVGRIVDRDAKVRQEHREADHRDLGEREAQSSISAGRNH